MAINDTPNTNKIMQVVFGLAFFGLGLFAVHGMMSHGTQQIKMIAAMIVAIGLVLALDTNYWLLCPASMMFGVRIPGLPFNSTEIGCLAVVCVHLVRHGLQRERRFQWDRRVVVGIPLLVWICLVWILNPTGLAIFGSRSIGVRFYIQILIGYATLFALSTLQIDEQKSKLLFKTMAAMIIARVAFAMLRSDMSQVDALEATTHYRFLVFYPLFVLLFSRYSLKEVLTCWWRFAVAGICGLAILYSGKRRTLGMAVMIPVIRMLLTGRERMLTVAIGICSVFMLFFAVPFDGLLFEMPNSAKRVLSMVVPKYRTANFTGLRDQFREGMRREAMRTIRADPMFGRKGFAQDIAETRWQFMGGVHSDTFEGHAMSGNWHSAFYAYPADFGIPAFLFFWLFFGTVIWTTVRAARSAPVGTFSSFCILYYTYEIMEIAIFAYTTGHSAVTTVDICVNYGMLVALANGRSVARGLRDADGVPLFSGPTDEVPLAV